MPSVVERAEEPEVVRPSVLLGRKIALLRQRHVAVRVATGLSLAVVAGVALPSVAMFLDWWLELPWAVRAVSILLQLGVVAGILWRRVMVPIIRPPDDDDLALMMERARPELRSRLIAAVQLTRPGALPPGASAVMAEATVLETEAVTAPLDFAAMVSLRRMAKLAGVALLGLTVGLVGLGYGQAVTFDLLKRLCLRRTPVPRKTHVVVLNGNKVVGRGDDVLLEAYARGVVPASGRVEVKSRRRPTQGFALQPDLENRSRFSQTLRSVQDSFTYVIYLNDGRSDLFRVTAAPRPAVVTIDCRQEYPAYTGLVPVKRALGDLSLLAGSLLRLEIQATKPMERAFLKPIGTNVHSPVSLQVQTSDPTRLLGQIVIPSGGLNAFSVELVDREGMASKDSAVYRIEILPDKPPVVRLSYPTRKEELVTREAKLIIGMDVSDDFRIAKMRLRYRVDRRDDGAEQVLEMDLAGEEPPRLQRQFVWQLSSFRPLLSEGSTIEYWLEAEDNNNATGPGIGISDHQLVKVVSEHEKRADLLNRAGDVFSSVTDATADQEELNKRLGTIILEKTGPGR